MIDIEVFANKKDYEKVEFQLRQHWIVPIRIVLIFLFMIALPMVIFWAAETFQPGLFSSAWVEVVATLALSIYCLMMLLNTYQSYLDYYLDTWTVTNERVLSRERTSVFHHSVSEVRLHRIQDVSSETKGFLASILGYGTVTIQTAGEDIHFTLDNIANPEQVAEKIIALADADREFHKDKLEDIAKKVGDAKAQHLASQNREEEL